MKRAHLLALGSTILATLAFVFLRPHFAYGQWALLYLLLVALVARTLGVKPAILAAALSFLAWNFFFLPPHGTFWVEDPKDWLSLLVFLVVAVIIGLQTGKMRERERQADQRRQEVVVLNRFGSELVSDISVPAMIRRLQQEMHLVAEAGRIALFLAQEDKHFRHFSTGVDGNLADRQTEQLVSQCFERAEVIADPNRRDLLLPLITSSSRVGVLHIAERPDGSSYSPHDTEMMKALSNLAAAFLERKQLQASAHLLSAISHELKTPLTSMMATLSNMLQDDVIWTEKKAGHELESMQLDIERLDEALSSLLDLSRLEAEAWRPRTEMGELGEVLSSVIYRLPSDMRQRITVLVPEGIPPIPMDAKQWARLFEHLIRNAFLYGGVNVSVRIGASCSEQEIRMWVEDDGPGVDAGEKERIFEKFFRGSAAAGLPGTGLGLSITREIVRAHEGRIWVEEAESRGARLMISVPHPNLRRFSENGMPQND